jgi:hypothetical protein
VDKDGAAVVADLLNDGNKYLLSEVDKEESQKYLLPTDDDMTEGNLNSGDIVMH